MNCKPGDIAVVVGTGEFVGMLVDILYAAPAHRFELPDGQWHMGQPEGRASMNNVAALYALSASPLSHAERPLGLAFFLYPDFSCGVQRKRTTAVAGFLRRGRPLGGLSMASIMWLQKVLDKWAAWVFTVATLNQEG